MMKIGKKLMVCLLAGMMAFSATACMGGGNAWGSVGGNSSSAAGGNSSSVAGGNSSVSGGTSADNSAATSADSSSSSGTTVQVKNPYKLKVYNFAGGYGSKWLDSLTSRYKAVKAGEEFTINGVTYDGVDFTIEGDKQTMSALSTAGVHYDVWFQEQVNYYQLVNAGKNFADMTDVMTSNNPYESGVTLESKLTDEQKDFYKVDTDKDGEGDTYYGLPHYAGYVGLVYNKKYFDAFGWYFKKGYNAANLESNPDRCFTADANNRTAGPDGKAGTEDDGLPTTYAEFYALCEYVSGMGLPAVTWSGKHQQGYLNWFLQAMTANYEGLDQMSLNFSFEGTAKNLISVDEDGNITDLPDLELDATENGYELAKQAGKYYALDFLENLVDNRGTWLSADAMDINCEQTTAQDHFVTGGAAMLVEGCWWEMEANQKFNEMAQSGGATAFTRDDFAWMPLPMATTEKAEERVSNIASGKNGYTMIDTHNSLAFIGKDISPEVYELAKDFIQFAYTDESLADFSIITDTTKAVKYTMTPDQKAKMSGYGRSLANMQESSDIVYSFSKSLFYQANDSLLYDNKTTFNARYTENGTVVTSPSDEFRKGKSAVDYFNALLWDQKYDWDKNIIK